MRTTPAATTSTSLLAGTLLLLLSISACDRFAHAKFEKSPWGTPDATNAVSSSNSSNPFGSGGAVDLVAPTCQAPSNGSATGTTSNNSTASLSGTGGEGAFCSTASDCAPVCCSCDSGQEWLAASCVANRCANGSVMCTRTGTCSTGGAPVGTAVIIGASGGNGGSSGGGSSSGSGGTAGGCGLTYDDTSCDDCMKTSCCQAEATCASDPVCSGGSADACAAQCANNDASCIDACENALASNKAATNLEACMLSSCSAACQ